MSGVPSPTSGILWLAEEFNSPASMLVNFITLFSHPIVLGFLVHLCHGIYTSSTFTLQNREVSFSGRLT